MTWSKTEAPGDHDHAPQIDTDSPDASAPRAPNGPIARLELPLERDAFLRSLLRHLSGTLEDVVGLEEAAGFVSVVGQAIGDEVNAMYTRAFRVDRLTREQVAAVCVDLKARIKGEFRVVEQDETRLVFANTRCPFDDTVVGRPSLCMMTSNVFGTIAAENLGYGKVSVERSIARGHDACRVVVYLVPPADGDAHAGREYFRKD